MVTCLCHAKMVAVLIPLYVLFNIAEKKIKVLYSLLSLGDLNWLKFCHFCWADLYMLENIKKATKKMEHGTAAQCVEKGLLKSCGGLCLTQSGILQSTTATSCVCNDRMESHLYRIPVNVPHIV